MFKILFPLSFYPPIYTNIPQSNCLLLELPFILCPNNTPPRKEPCPQGCNILNSSMFNSWWKNKTFPWDPTVVKLISQLGAKGYKILFESDQSAISCSSCQTTVVSNDDKSFPNTIEASSTWQWTWWTTWSVNKRCYGNMSMSPDYELG